MGREQRTIGQALAGMDVLTAGALGGLLLVAVGSIAPWVTTPFGSASGTNGDGKSTLILAAFGAFLVLRRQRVGTAIDCLLILGIGVYEGVHIHHAVARTTLFGRQLDHVGWGVYVVIAGALLTLAMMYQARERGVGETLRDWTRKQV